MTHNSTTTNKPSAVHSRSTCIAAVYSTMPAVISQCHQSSAGGALSLPCVAESVLPVLRWLPGGGRSPPHGGAWLLLGASLSALVPGEGMREGRRERQRVR